jgi:interferon-induced GTP-binding protein Mx1
MSEHVSEGGSDLEIESAPGPSKRPRGAPTDMTMQMKEKVRPYVDAIDGLRGLGIEKDVAIPQIVVMGDQSSGKSSVLEAISGVNFPRGVGLVTKCATELRMKRASNSDRPWRANIKLSWDRPQPRAAGEIQNKEDIGERIMELTERLLQARGDHATFEPEHSIIIELESSDVPDLTVIDVPGIVRTTVAGQEASVIEQVDGLISRYLRQDRTVILAVIPTNVSSPLCRSVPP